MLNEVKENTAPVALLYQKVGSCVSSLLTFGILLVGLCLLLWSPDSLIVSVNPTAAGDLLLPSPQSPSQPPNLLGAEWNTVFFFFFWYVCVLAVPCSMQDLSSPTRDRTWASCGGSVESSPLDHQGSPWNTVLTVPLKHLQFRRGRFHPWVGKIPWRRKWQPTLVFLPGESRGQTSLVGYSPWAHRESDMTE